MLLCLGALELLSTSSSSSSSSSWEVTSWILYLSWCANLYVYLCCISGVVRAQTVHLCASHVGNGITHSSALSCWQAKPAKKMCVMWLPNMTIQLRVARNWTYVRMNATFCWMTQNIGGVFRMLATRQAMCPATMSKRKSPLCLTGTLSSNLEVIFTKVSSVWTVFKEMVVLLCWHIFQTDLNFVAALFT